MATDNFSVFALALRKHFEKLAKDRLFEVAVERNDVWERYLAAFPEGSNPIFRTNTEHDCSCCRHFIRDIGNVVVFSGKNNAELITVWDLKDLPYPYQDVADTLAAYVRELAVTDVFLVPFNAYGVEKNLAMIDDNPRTFHHFRVEVPRQHVNLNWEAKRGDLRTTFAVLKRGLTEFTAEALAAVIDLIDQGMLYRGTEFKKQLTEFQALHASVRGINDERILNQKVWQAVDKPIARFRNTVIGTLVSDLSEGYDLEDCVKAYEQKVAPENYRRPKALITKGMVEQATKTIAELGLEEALERRHARLSDVSINSVLFVDNEVRGQLKGGLADLLMEEVKPAPFNKDAAERISITKFLETVLPRAAKVQLYLETSQFGNFMSLTAPVHSEVKQLFRWNNDFAWSYDGNVADSIKARVKRAGGRVENVTLRASLAWFNHDDLDLHAYEPDGTHIYFGHRKSQNGNSGELDVDMNVRTYVRNAVENIRWTHALKFGRYIITVNQFNKRESIDVGFEVELESAGGLLTTLRYEKALGHGQTKRVAEIHVGDRGVVTIEPSEGMAVGHSMQEKWGLTSGQLVRVNSVILSPNYWDGQAVGNMHWFFILDKCHNPLPTRGMYNEFLNPRLEKHRKVFEVLGDKVKCPVVPDQMSGLGFSSTQPNEVTVLVSGPKLNRAYTIVFGGKEM